MEQDKMREEFEAAYAEEMRSIYTAYGEDYFDPSKAFKRNEEGIYELEIVQSAFWGWQASRAAVVVVLPYAGTLLAPQWNEAIDRCRAAIHAAGIRTR